MKVIRARRRLAIVRQKKGKEPSSEPAFAVEIWSSARLLRSVDCKAVGEKKPHAVYADGGWFGALRWSRDERTLVYVAEPAPAEDFGDSFWRYVK